MHLGYKVCNLNGYWFMDISLSHWLYWKNDLWSIKSRNEDTVAVFWVCLVVFTRGVHKSVARILGPVVSKLYAYSIENPLLLWVWQRSYWSGSCMFGSSLIDTSTLMIKIFHTQRWQCVPLWNVSNVKTFCDHGDLDNKVRVKLVTCNEKPGVWMRICFNISNCICGWS